ncbi:MAG: trypsin-like peptidase domain-containing protein [Antricoccus sp.]
MNTSSSHQSTAWAPTPIAGGNRRLGVTAGVAAIVTATMVICPIALSQPASISAAAFANHQFSNRADRSGAGHGGTANSGSTDGGSTNGSGGGGSTNGGSANGSGQSSALAQTNSSAATAAQSVGVVLINSVVTGGEALGTGIVLSANGEIVTNYHVVQGSTSVQVIMPTTGKSYTATVTGDDPTGDVAVLHINASGLSVAKIDTTIEMTGTAVTAVGNAGGQNALTAATGTITATGQTITASGEGGSGSSETLNGLYQTNADIIPGDSGGPLRDGQGDVIGIDTAASSTNGSSQMQTTSADVQGFAIPIVTALRVADQIEQGRSSGPVRIGPPAFLGIELARSSGPVTIAGVVAGDPAAAAGLTAGDTITALGNTAITSATDLTNALASYQPGQNINLAWTDSAGASQAATVTLAPSPTN